MTEDDQKTTDNEQPEWPDFTYDELSAANAYVDTIEQHSANTKLPVSLTAKLRAFYRSPSLELCDNTSHELAAQALEQTYQSYEAGTDDYSDIHERAVFYMLALARSAADIRLAVLGPDDPPNFAESGMLGRAIGEIVWGLPPIEREKMFEIQTHSMAMATANPKNLWYQTKMAQYLNTANGRRLALDYLTSPESNVDVEALRQENDRLAESIRFLQKYMPKDCIAPALPGSKTLEWLVWPPLENWKSSKYHPANRLNILLYGSADPLDTSQAETYDFGSSGYSLRLTAFSAFKNKEITFAAAIGEHGDLFDVLGIRMVDHLPPEALSAYEQLRSELLCIYYDSTVPVYYTELAERQHAAGEQRIDDEQATPDEQRVSKLRRLVLARRLIAEHHKPAIIEELDHPDSDIVKRHIAKHNVIGHIRRLPDTFKAGPDARQQCLKYMGIVLAEYGETFVIPHQRGTEENGSKGHKVIYSSGKMASRMSETPQ